MILPVPHIATQHLRNLMARDPEESEGAGNAAIVRIEGISGTAVKADISVNLGRFGIDEAKCFRFGACDDELATIGRIVSLNGGREGRIASTDSAGGQSGLNFGIGIGARSSRCVLANRTGGERHPVYLAPSDNKVDRDGCLKSCLIVFEYLVECRQEPRRGVLNAGIEGDVEGQAGAHCRPPLNPGFFSMSRGRSSSVRRRREPPRKAATVMISHPSCNATAQEHGRPPIGGKLRCWIELKVN